MNSLRYLSVNRVKHFPSITTLHNPFEDDDDIHKGVFWVEPKADSCADQDRGSQCPRPRMQGSLLCKYHYYMSHDSLRLH